MTQNTAEASQWQVTCQCGWRVHGTKDEVVPAVQEHGRSAHSLEVSEEQVMALAVPAGLYPPLVLDMATGAVAWGKIFVAQQEGKKIPTSWALDKHGAPTDDPNAAADHGLIQPFGGYKGYGLSLFIDILTGVLCGGGFSTHVKSLYQKVASPSEVAQTFAAIRIDAFMPLPEFCRRVDEMIDLIHSCPRAPGVDRIYVPGEIEYETEQHRRAEGIPIHPTLREELAALGKELGVPSPF